MFFVARRNFLQFLFALSFMHKDAKANQSLKVAAIPGVRPNVPDGAELRTIKLADQLPNGYVADGSIDYTKNVQSVLDSLHIAGGGRLELPPNASLLVGNLMIYSNIQIVGDQDTSILKIKPGCIGFSINPAGKLATAAKNIKLSKFKIIGTVEQSGFSEHLHLLNFSGVSNLTIEDLQIIGPQGDGVYLGFARNAAGAIHNEDVRISNVLIDGVNKNNRNGISIIDGSRITIDKVKIRRFSRKDMPGAIDIEPDSESLARINDISISNVIISDCGGNVGAISAVFKGAIYAVPPKKIRINSVTIEGGVSNAFAFISEKPDNASPGPLDVDISVTNCVARNGLRAFTLVGVSNVKISKNTFEDFKQSALVGFRFREKNICENIQLTKNTWIRCGKEGGTGLDVYSVFNLKISDKFIDCGSGKPGQAYAIMFNVGISRSVDISDTEISSPTGKTQVAIRKGMGHIFNGNNRADRIETHQLVNEFTK